MAETILPRAPTTLLMRESRPTLRYDPDLWEVLAAVANGQDVTPLMLVIRQLAYWHGSDQGHIPRVSALYHHGPTMNGCHQVGMRRVDWTAIFPSISPRAVERTGALGTHLGVLRIVRSRHLQWWSVNFDTLRLLYDRLGMPETNGWLTLPPRAAPPATQLSADVELALQQVIHTDMDNLTQSHASAILEPQSHASVILEESRQRDSLTLRDRDLREETEEKAGRPVQHPDPGNGDNMSWDPATVRFTEVAGTDPSGGLDTWARRYREQGYPLDDIVGGLYSVAHRADARDITGYVVSMLKGAWDETGTAHDGFRHLEERVGRLLAADAAASQPRDRGYSYYFDRRR